jgi:hypothetical protein
MKLISNKGNLNGISENENKPEFIENAINLGYDVKIDLWLQDNQLYLGSSKPEFKLDIDWFEKFHQKLWLDCHDLTIIDRFYDLDPMGTKLNYFYIHKDPIARTSKWYNIVWGEKPIKGCVFMYPEIHPEFDYTQCFGLISSQIMNYK